MKGGISRSKTIDPRMRKKPFLLLFYLRIIRVRIMADRFHFIDSRLCMHACMHACMDPLDIGGSTGIVLPSAAGIHA